MGVLLKWSYLRRCTLYLSRRMLDWLRGDRTTGNLRIAAKEESNPTQNHFLPSPNHQLLESLHDHSEALESIAFPQTTSYLRIEG